jgi:hypothetical protein
MGEPDRLEAGAGNFTEVDDAHGGRESRVAPEDAGGVMTALLAQRGYWRDI